jgi:2-keto-4-pentenoate hydratase/2-oxohepta-3-ene-1,7-dioic acid hydratase in catechol pathway
MKFVTIRKEQEQVLGVVADGHVIDISEALKVYPEAGIKADIMTVIEQPQQLATIQKYVDKVLKSDQGQERFLFKENEIVYGPCVTRPSKIICVGLNYRKHAEETNADIPKYPILFNKFSNTLAGHGEEISLPERVTSQVDYEAELVIVIGKQAKYVEKDAALKHVFGYSCVNDLSARDLQLRTPQWLLGKTCDKFSPLGPWLVTADEVGNPNKLAIKSTVNGEVRQQSNTSDMIFSCAEVVSYISQHMTLCPGDIILTGTPEGVVLGLPEEQRVYLKDGDVVTIEIEKLGALMNRMISE